MASPSCREPELPRSLWEHFYCKPLFIYLLVFPLGLWDPRDRGQLQTVPHHSCLTDSVNGSCLWSKQSPPACVAALLPTDSAVPLTEIYPPNMSIYHQIGQSKVFVSGTERNAKRGICGVFGCLKTITYANNRGGEMVYCSPRGPGLHPQRQV